MSSYSTHRTDTRTSRIDVAGGTSRMGWVLDIGRDRDHVRRRQDNLSLCLLGVFVDDRAFEIHEIERKVNHVWNKQHRVSVQKLNGKRYLFGFANQVDKRDVLEKNPWSIFGAFLVLKEWVRFMSPQEHKFGPVGMWVQAHGLPMDYLDDTMTATLAPYAGPVLDFDKIGDDNLISSVGYLRFKVEIYLNDPLVAGVFVPTNGKNLVWVGFRYEKISRVCLRCGRIGHFDTRCQLPQHVVDACIQTRLERARQLEWETMVVQSSLPMYAREIVCADGIETQGSDLFLTFEEDRPVNGQMNVSVATSTHRPVLSGLPSATDGALGFHAVLFGQDHKGSDEGST